MSVETYTRFIPPANISAINHLSPGALGRNAVWRRQNQTCIFRGTGYFPSFVHSEVVSDFVQCSQVITEHKSLQIFDSVRNALSMWYNKCSLNTKYKKILGMILFLPQLVATFLWLDRIISSTPAPVMEYDGSTSGVLVFVVLKSFE